MDRSSFDDSMAWMQKEFKSPQDEDRLNHYWVVFGQSDDKVFFAAVERILKEQTTFPTPLELGNAIHECVLAKPKDKPKEKTYVDAPAAKITTQMGKDAFALLHKLEEDPENFGPKELAVAMMIDMHEKYPNAGWEEEGQKLLMDYERMKESAKNFENSIFSLRRKAIR